jgi:hypothetical protein
MASSRWKRFAFFERQSLTIPDAVLGDLTLSSSNDGIDWVLTTAALPAHTKPTSVQVTSELSQPTAVSAMWSSLTACHPVEETRRSDSVQLKSQGQIASSSETRTSTTTLLDGLVLSFASSPNSSRIHCFDLTVRCNPSPQSSSASSEDLDGWRGYWTPFSQAMLRQQQPTTNIPQSTDSSVLTSVVVAIAACRVPPSSHSSHSPLHVACWGNRNELVVWEDPHLYLSCRVPVHDTAGGDSAVVLYTVPTGSKWNASSDGEATVLDIAPGIVAVGTTTGVVVLYSYTPATMSTSSVTMAGKNPHLSRMLRPFVRIPSPPVADVQVVSVTLSLSAHQNKASVFVSYNRAARTSPNNNATTSPSLGICCYDFAVPSSSVPPSSSSAPPNVAAPLARYDLDGRYVTRRHWVDSYTRRRGGRILTVVRESICTLF